VESKENQPTMNMPKRSMSSNKIQNTNTNGNLL